MEQEEKKKFEPFKTRPIRMSNKVWELLRQSKLESGLSWDKYINSIIDKKNK